MATKNTEPAFDAVVAAELESAYRNGVDISLFELAERFEADGHDWRAALLACGYSAEQIADEVDSID